MRLQLADYRHVFPEGQEVRWRCGARLEYMVADGLGAVTVGVVSRQDGAAVCMGEADSGHV